MAIAADKTSNLGDLLTCTICLETFTEPKYLPCLHTFCKTCINTYILSTVKKEKSQTTFKCPICRQKVLMEESAENPQIWADKLPGNHFVVSMMDRQAIRRREKICDSCKMNNESKNAFSWCIVCEEAFCESCEKCHKSFRMTARHPTILMKDIIINKELVSTSCLIYCEEHPGEVLKAYCVDHSKPICTLCATLSHRKCQDVTTVEAAASGIKESQKVKELSAKLKGMSKQLSDLIQNRKEHTVDFEKEADAAFRRVSTIKYNIVKHLNTIEEQIKGEINKSKKEVVLKLSDKSTELESLKSTVDNWVTIFDICLQHGSELQCLLEMNRIKENKDNFSDLLTKSISGLKNVSMILETNAIAEEFADRVAVLGVLKLVDIKANCSNSTSVKNVDFHTKNINVVKVIDLTGQFAYLSGLFMKDEFIFTHSQLLKVLKYSDNGDCLAELKLPNSPYDIDKINDTIVAISANLNNMFIINTYDMSLCRIIENTYPVHGFSHVNGEFILACSNTLTWINTSTGVKTEQTRTNGSTYFIYAEDRKHYIFADGKNTVTKMANNIKAFTYTNSKLKSPRDIDVDREGNVYICGYKSENIHQLSNDGRLVRIFRTGKIGIKQPWVIRFKKDSNQFLVTCYRTGKVVVCEII